MISYHYNVLLYNWVIYNLIAKSFPYYSNSTRAKPKEKEINDFNSWITFFVPRMTANKFPFPCLKLTPHPSKKMEEQSKAIRSDAILIRPLPQTVGFFFFFFSYRNRIRTQKTWFLLSNIIFPNIRKRNTTWIHQYHKRKRNFFCFWFGWSKNHQANFGAIREISPSPNNFKSSFIHFTLTW